MVDPEKNRPAHHIRKIHNVPRIPKHVLPKENNTVVVGMVGSNSVLRCYVGSDNVTVMKVSV